ncbi:hypothetical protein PGT21_014658 [Puccinia graminis f. sp. tritici]|uniref:Uncharacterized protein n=1 Tax=Puccinia graminis f. sp. tritici TaxID=56615 RepID=A0A5B0QFF9_PUCGR|nr:hypothetical protein PGT21_014658 [Puccinia graminis f. sp. tritici]
MAQLGNSGVKIDSKTLEDGQFEENQQRLMQEDWKSLRDDLRKSLESPDYSLWFKEQLEDPGDYELFDAVVRLNELRNKIEEAEKYYMKEVEIRSFKTNLQGKGSEAINQTYKRIITSLLSLAADMRPYIQVELPKIKFLYLQRSVFEAVYYLYKYKLISPKDLGALFEKYETIKDFAEYIFHSYRFSQQGKQ